ncbi:MAG: hypothetical protein DHS20C14_03050 [Phycisphaeraceae bacterium]|nr:MAG: hypothetical protein DHS20C14_03050 [Phycisphaeraceae bacterium]
MRPDQHDTFWQLYERDARGPLDAACRGAVRRLSDSTMDPADLIAWVDTRVWTMLEKGAYPTFHDDPTPEQAIQRIVDNAATLSRWAYLGLSRGHWRRTEREQAHIGGMSRAERLATVSTVGNGFEQSEQLKGDLAKVRATLSDTLKAKIAASWPEKDERRQVAQILGATRPEDDELIHAATSGEIKENTVQQMRSRTRKRLAELFQNATPLFALVAVLAIGLASGQAYADEQSGGRGGLAEMRSTDAGDLGPISGEQSGGRKGGKQIYSRGGEQSGGRG